MQMYIFLMNNKKKVDLLPQLRSCSIFFVLLQQQANEFIYLKHEKEAFLFYHLRFIHY